MTGSTDGRPYHSAGTVPAASRPGPAYLGEVRSTVASTVPAGTVACHRVAACSAGAEGMTLRTAVLPDGPPPESSSPADTAAAAAPMTPTVIAVRDTRPPLLVSAGLACPRNTAHSPFLHPIS